MSLADWRIRPLGAAILILLLAFALRAYHITDQSLRGDEAFSITFVRLDWQQMLYHMRTGEDHPPLYYFTFRVWTWLAGESELAARFYALFFGVLLVPLGYRLARETLGEWSAALTAALLLAVNPYLIWHSQDARMYTLLLALGTGSVLLAWRLWRQGTWQVWGSYLITSLACAFTHYSAIFLFLVQNLAFLVTGFRQYSWRRWLVAQTILALFYVGWLAYTSGMILFYTKSWLSTMSLPTMVVRSVETYSLGLHGGEAVGAWPLWGFGVLALLGGWTAWRHSSRHALMLIIWVLMPLLLAYLISMRRPMYDERYLILVMIPYLLLVARGIAAPLGWRRFGLGGGLYMMAIGLVLISSAVALGHYYFDPAYAKSPDWRGLVRYLRQEFQPGDVVVQNMPDPSLTYYLQGSLPYTVLPSAAPLDKGRTDRELERLVRSYTRVWFLPYLNPGWDGEGYVQAWLEQHAMKIKELTAGGMAVELYITRLLSPGRGPLLLDHR